jgi:hypothetical protein
MSEQSPEATVAGDAAAQAVEELHSREAVVDAANAAEIEAATAADMSAIAVEAAVDAAEISQQAVGEAQQASSQAVEAQDAAEMSVAEMRAMRAEMGEVRSFVGELYDDYKSRKDAESSTAVTEVPVNDRAAAEGNAGTATDTNSGQTSNAAPASTQSAPDKSPPAQRGSGLRRRNR